MAEIPSDRMRGTIGPEHPDINRASRVRVLLWQPLLRYSHANAARLGVQMMPHQIHIAKRRRHQKVGLASARYEVSGYILTIMRIVPHLFDAQHVLGRRG